MRFKNGYGQSLSRRKISQLSSRGNDREDYFYYGNGDDTQEDKYDLMDLNDPENDERPENDYAGRRRESIRRDTLGYDRYDSGYDKEYCSPDDDFQMAHSADRQEDDDYYDFSVDVDRHSKDVYGYRAGTSERRTSRRPTAPRHSFASQQMDERGVKRGAKYGTPAFRKNSRRGSAILKRHYLVNAYCAYFRLVEEDPSEELATVKDINMPLIKTSRITLPFDLSNAVADNCLSLSCMGYSLGIGGCCPTCSARGDECQNNRSHDRASLTLAYVQQINEIYQYRIFMASIVALATKESQAACQTNQFSGDCGGAKSLIETILAKALSRPELFFAFHVLKDGGIGELRVLFYQDHESSGDYMMYVVFPGKSVHLHHRLIDCLQEACRGYRLIAHVWQTTFVLIVRADGDRQQDSVDKTPQVNAEDVYCKLCDLNINGELLSEYAKLYSTFDDFLPPV